jgi:hypothetical protein
MFGNRSSTVVHEPTTTTVMWSPAQLVAGVIGVAAIVWGALALSRTGLDFDELTARHDSFAGFHHTPLLALAEIGFGILMVIAALRPVFGRTVMALVGAAAVGLGGVVVADVWPRRMHDWLGAHDRNGWMFIAAGGVVLLAAFVLPILGTNRTQRVVEERRVVDDD